MSDKFWKCLWWTCRHEIDGQKDEPCPYCRIEELESQLQARWEVLQDIYEVAYVHGFVHAADGECCTPMHMMDEHIQEILDGLEGGGDE